jgi:hypothetical protein
MSPAGGERKQKILRFAGEQERMTSSAALAPSLRRGILGRA